MSFGGGWEIKTIENVVFKKWQLLSFRKWKHTVWDFESHRNASIFKMLEFVEKLLVFLRYRNLTCWIVWDYCLNCEMLKFGGFIQMQSKAFWRVWKVSNRIFETFQTLQSAFDCIWISPANFNISNAFRKLKIVYVYTYIYIYL